MWAQNRNSAGMKFREYSADPYNVVPPVLNPKIFSKTS